MVRCIYCYFIVYFSSRKGLDVFVWGGGRVFFVLFDSIFVLGRWTKFVDMIFTFLGLSG